MVSIFEAYFESGHVLTEYIFHIKFKFNALICKFDS